MLLGTRPRKKRRKVREIEMRDVLLSMICAVSMFGRDPLAQRIRHNDLVALPAVQAVMLATCGGALPPPEKPGVVDGRGI